MNKFLISFLLTLATISATAQSQPVSHSWNGLINGKWPVQVYVEAMNGIVQGQIIYTNSKAKTPIKLLGSAAKDEFELRENDANGNITGFISGKITSDGGFSGTWKAPGRLVKTGSLSFDYKEGKIYSLALSKCARPSPDPLISWEIDLKYCSGTYCYSYGENLACGVLKLSEKAGKVLCTIDAATSAPSFNMAKVEERECVVLHDRLLCTLSPEETYSDGECQFEIIPYRDFATINYIDRKNRCGFGMNATIAETYLKSDQQNNVTQYAWTGNLKGSIPVEVLLEVRADNLVGGEMRYTRTGSGQPVRLLGELGAGGLIEYCNRVFLDEYQPDGYQSGHIDFDFSDRKKCEGKWSDDNNFFTMSLTQPIVFPSNKGNFFEKADDSEIEGTYVFKYSRPAGGDRVGRITITRDHDGIRFEYFSNVSGITEYSNETDSKGASLENGKFKYTVKSCDYQFEVEFFKGFLHIKNLNYDMQNCVAAELNSSFNGYYIKKK